MSLIIGPYNGFQITNALLQAGEKISITSSFQLISVILFDLFFKMGNQSSHASFNHYDWILRNIISSLYSIIMIEFVIISNLDMSHHIVICVCTVILFITFTLPPAYYQFLNSSCDPGALNLTIVFVCGPPIKNRSSLVCICAGCYTLRFHF